MSSIIDNIKKEKKENTNDNKSQSRFSDYLREDDYKEEVNQIKELKINPQENKNSKNDDTSVSHIIEDVNYDKKFGDIYNEMCQILRHSLFIFTVEKDKISINYKNDKNKKYEDLIKDMENFKTKILELIDNYEKFKNFLEKVKNEIKTKIKNRKNFTIELELYENIENSRNNHKNINCKYRINKYKNLDEENFIDEDILCNISLHNFNHYINLNEIEEQLKEKENFKFLYMHTQNIDLRRQEESDGKKSYINENEYTRDIGKMEYYIERERNELIDIQKHDQEFDKIRLEGKEEMKNLNNKFENEMLKLNNSNNFIIPNNQQMANSNQIEMNNLNRPFYLPGEKKLISDIINILNHSTINIGLNSKKEFDFNIIKFWDNTFLKEINYSDFKNELKNKDQKLLDDANYINLFDNFEKLIDFIKKIIVIAEKKLKNCKLDIYEIKLNFKEIGENNNNKIKYISCEYKLVTPLICSVNDKNYSDSNILFSDNYPNFEKFLEETEKIYKS